MARILIKNGRILDPANGIDAVMDLLLDEGKILKIAPEIGEEAQQIIDAEGLWVVPGLIDMHVHFRDPGYTDKETIETGCRAALAGGFTTVCCMPNTNPICHNKEVVSYIKQKSTLIHVLPVGSLTMNQEGLVPAALEEMAEAGACGFSEDGKTLADAELFKQIMTTARALNLPILSHCEDITLVAGGVIGEGNKAQEFGLKGISNESESVIAARDIALAKAVGARVHLCHVSTRQTVAILSRAKEEGLQVTGEAAPHHFVLSDEDIDRNWAGYKMNPPLRSRQDVDAVMEGLRHNILEVIATDHAPHTREEKDTTFQKGLNGIIGLETAVPLCITELVDKEVLTPMQLIAKMTTNPAKILGIDKGTLLPGRPADVTVIDPAAVYHIAGEDFQSKCKITPFEGRKVRGRVRYTIVSGEIRYTHT